MFEKLQKIKEWIFGKEWEIEDTYAQLKWKEVAKDRCVGGESMKEIIIKDKDGGVKDVREFTEEDIKSLERSNIPVVNKEIKDHIIPKKCSEKPDVVRRIY